MAAPVISWRNSSNVVISPPLVFSSVVPGTPTAATEVRLYNNYGSSGSDSAQNLRLRALVRDPGETAWVADGRDFVDRRSVQVRLVSGLVDLVTRPIGWTSLGSGAALPLPDITDGDGVKLEVRVYCPADYPSDDVEVLLRLESARAESLEVGHTEWGTDGVRLGYGDGTMTQLLTAGDVVENGAGVDDYVDLPILQWVHEGIPYSKVASTKQLTGNDGDSAALLAGEAYYALLSLGGSTTVTLTKGSKDTTPLTDADKPDIPEGEIPLAWVIREFDALVNNADIDNVYEIGGFSWSATGLTATLGPGEATVDNAYVRHTTSENATLTASKTNLVYLLRDGSLSVTDDGTRPTDRALLLYQAVTDGSGVTTLTDLRPWIGARTTPITFIQRGALAANDYTYSHWPYSRTGYVRIPTGVIASLSDDGTTSGSTIIDIETSDGGAAFATIFTSAGTDDQRPTIAYNSTTLTDTTAVPEVLTIPPFARIRAKVVQEAGGNDSADLAVTLIVEAP